MKIAIPTHRRAETIHGQTLSLLGGFAKSDVYIFISDESDYQLYEQQCKGYNLVLCNTQTATQKFNYIQGYFTGDEYIFVLEDDIKKIQSLASESLPKIFNYMEQYCRLNRISAFGVYPSANKFFMSKTIDVGLTFLVANLFGYKANTSEQLMCELPVKTDYERSIRYFNAFGAVARFNFISCLTNNYTNKGGMQEMSDRAKLEQDASVALCEKYPTIFSINPNRKSKYTELKMKKSVTKTKL